MTCALVKVSPAPEPIYPEGKGVEDQTLYVRLGNTTTTLSARQAVAYARDRRDSISLRRSYFRRPAMQPAV
jgi:hypothetical protein